MIGHFSLVIDPTMAYNGFRADILVYFSPLEVSYTRQFIAFSLHYSPNHDHKALFL